MKKGNISIIILSIFVLSSVLLGGLLFNVVLDGLILKNNILAFQDKINFYSACNIIINDIKEISKNGENIKIIEDQKYTISDISSASISELNPPYYFEITYTNHSKNKSISKKFRLLNKIFYDKNYSYEQNRNFIDTLLYKNSYIELRSSYLDSLDAESVKDLYLNSFYYINSDKDSIKIKTDFLTTGILYVKGNLFIEGDFYHKGLLICDGDIKSYHSRVDGKIINVNSNNTNFIDEYNDSKFIIFNECKRYDNIVYPHEMKNR